MPDESVRMEIRLKNFREVGAVYEEQAVSFLLENGYQIADRNFSCRMGEIDIIAWSPSVQKERYLVFFEVKYRKNSYAGYPEEAVDFRKQKKIIQTANYYLMVKNYHTIPPCRFDIIAIENKEIRHIIDAFQVD